MHKMYTCSAIELARGNIGSQGTSPNNLATLSNYFGGSIESPPGSDVEAARWSRRGGVAATTPRAAVRNDRGFLSVSEALEATPADEGLLKAKPTDEGLLEVKPTDEGL